MKSWSQPAAITPRKSVFWALLFALLIATVPALMIAAVPAMAETKPFTPTAADRADLTRAQNYLNGIGTLKSRFLQASSNGAFAEGILAISRPGKLRLEYDPPVQMLIVADGTWLIYKDLELDEITYLPLNSTPAGIIVRDKMSFFDDDIRVLGIERGPAVLSITVTGKDPDEGSMTLVFGERPMALKKWIIIDPQGVKTSISLLSTHYGVTLNPRLFVVKQPDREVVN